MAFEAFIIASPGNAVPLDHRVGEKLVMLNDNFLIAGRE
jgi:hypothetical protein